MNLANVRGHQAEKLINGNNNYSGYIFSDLILPPADSSVYGSVLERSISHLDVPYRALKCFETMGIKTIRDFVQMTHEELLSMPGFGRRSLSQVNAVVSDCFNGNGKKIKKNRWTHLMDLYITYYSYEAVGRQLGVSRQRVQQLVSFGQRIGVLPEDLVGHAEKIREKQRISGLARKISRKMLILDYVSLGNRRKIIEKYRISNYSLCKLLKYYRITPTYLRKAIFRERTLNEYNELVELNGCGTEAVSMKIRNRYSLYSRIRQYWGSYEKFVYAYTNWVHHKQGLS
jgi:hypothetical protein